MPANRRSTDDDLLQRFFATFVKFSGFGHDDLSDELAWHDSVHADRSDSLRGWNPQMMATDRSLLAALYQRLGCSFPALYERAICSYRWHDVHLGERMRLFGNPPGGDFAAILGQITADPVLRDVLLPRGYVQFGRAADGSYDPVCFATSQRAVGDCPVVRIEHEAPLQSGRIGDVWEIAPTFRDLVNSVIADAGHGG